MLKGSSKIPAKILPPAMRPLWRTKTRKKARPGRRPRSIPGPERPQGGFRLRKLRDHRAMGMKNRRGHQDHGAVNGPAHDHGEERVRKLVFQLMTDGLFRLEIPLAALDDFRMKINIVRHHHGPEHAHHDGKGPAGKRRNHPAFQGRTPLDLDETQFNKEGQPDQRNEPDDPFLQFRITVGKQQDRRQNRRSKSPRDEGEVRKGCSGQWPRPGLPPGPSKSRPRPR